MNRIVCIAILCLLAISGANAKQRLVRDADAFNETMKKAQPGDVILLAKGSWTNVELVAAATGTAQSPITVRAEVPGKVIVSGKSRLRVSGRHVVVSGIRFHQAWHKTGIMELRKEPRVLASDCVVSDCEFVDCVNPPGEDYKFKYLSVYGKRNIVQRCRFSGKTNRGTTLVVWLDDEGGQHKIRDNHFGPRPELKSNEGETIRIGDSDSAHQDANCVVERNLFEQCNGEGEIVSNKSCNNLYQNNVFRRCSGTLTLRHGHRCTVRQNLFLGEKARGTGGVRVIGSDHVVINNRFERLEGSDYRCALVLMNGIADSPANGYQPVQRALIAHNTIVDCKRSILVGADNDEKKQVPPTDCRFINNSISSRRGPMIDRESKANRTQWLGNLWYGDGKLGIDTIEGVTRAKSDLMSKPDDRWQLFQASPLIGAAVAADGMPKIDFAGQTRDSSPDVGCDEWPVEMASWMTDVRVGPSWDSVSLDPDN